MAVNPTRMELKKIKARLKTAVRGHKLLKDKSDEMIRQFTLLIKKNYELRVSVEKELSKSLDSFLLAKANVSGSILEEALMLPSVSMHLSCDTKNVMSVKVPKIHMETTAVGSKLPYGLFSMTAELDDSVASLRELLQILISLAEVEKACNMLADEIEKNKRRVNALEYVMIPTMKQDIKYITMKLEENERASLVRLMKVKSMIEQKEIV